MSLGKLLIADDIIEALQNTNFDESNSDDDYVNDYSCMSEDYIPPPLNSSSDSTLIFRLHP